MNTIENDKTITLHIFNDIVEANFVKNKLEENGIKSFLEDENVLGLNPLGGVQVIIFERDLKAAKEILSTEDGGV